MGKFKALIGDLFESDSDTIVNTVNCVGVMGKGVALIFKKRFPSMYEDYIIRCNRGLVKLGEPYLYEDLTNIKIINFPTKGHWRSASRLSDIEKGLDYFVENYKKWNVKSISMPPLGCGNGGLEWKQVGPLIYKKLSNLPIEVKVFAPYGTNSNELTIEFLSSPTQLTLEDKGSKQEKMNPGWIAIMEVLNDLQSQPYAPHVGRVIFQKICYVLTLLGVPTGFEFGKGSYGPFSADIKPAINNFSNKNWILEESFGRMLEIRVGVEYAKDRKKFEDEINKYKKSIDKTVDLFSRIKNTDQAEEAMTVLFAVQQLKKGDRNSLISEKQIYNYILDWKKSWKKDQKKIAVIKTIKNLSMLGWMRVLPSEFSEIDDK